MCCVCLCRNVPSDNVIPDDDQEIGIITIMQKELPLYIVKCFSLAGYDEKEVIMSMDTSNKEGNSISIIEKYIDQRHKNDPEVSPGVSSTHPELPFMFPPGHRIRIRNFVKMFKETSTSSSKRLLDASADQAKTAKRHKTNPVSHVHNYSHKVLSSTEIACQVRESIKNWSQKPKNERFKHLEDEKHYLVLVNEEGNDFTVKVACLQCPARTAIRLQKVNDHYQISNWTKHVGNCFKSSLDNQPTLNQLFSKGSNTTNSKTCKVAESSTSLSVKHHTSKQGPSEAQANDNQVF